MATFKTINLSLYSAETEHWDSTNSYMNSQRKIDSVMQNLLKFWYKLISIDIT